jgi:DNA transposition AAA+ family ATPase
MAIDIREKTRAYMAQQGLSRAEMARRAGLSVPVFCKWLDRRHHGSEPRQTEATLTAYFKRTELIERQRQKQFLQLRTSAIVLERCEEARREKELVVLYGPPGISKTFSLREYIRQRADQGDHKVLLITANAVTTPRALLLALCRLLALPTSKKGTHVLVEEVIDKLNRDPHLILVDEANHLNVQGLELLRHIHDMTECGMVLVGTKRLYDLFTNGGRKSQDLEQLWSRVGIHDLLPGLSPAEVRQIAQTSLGKLEERATVEIQRTTRGSARRLAKLVPRLQRLQELNPATPTERLVPAAAGQIIA